ncbi:MAG: hypothetical protein HKN12_10535 [Gemmatimonadetes bacterium]|nr:hypothetical protein [Gemmatimonadota bacterium]
MAEAALRTSARERVQKLTAAYRTILGAYEDLESLTETELAYLSEGRPLAEVNELLRTKRERLREIRVEEERVTGEREWWKKSRRSLPPRDCRELLSLLDSISRTIERTVSGEAECRSRLEQAVAWGADSPLRPAANPKAAASAYARGNHRSGERA